MKQLVQQAPQSVTPLKPIATEQFPGENMIVYDPFWYTLKKRNISTYKLFHTYGISSHTIHRLRHNSGVSTSLINELCNLLDCKVEDILRFVPQSSDQRSAL